ncbi:MAG: DNA-binding protein [Clostridia bacterium]|nr:DNA-binding protein [Clostridia bacterium]
MDKVSFIALWDAYRGLLTPTQQEITDMYFNLDLTLSEIADEKGITRQGVSECLKTCKKQLEEYEEKLGFVKKLSEISLRVSFAATDIGKWAEGFMHAHPEYTQDIANLLAILDKEV